MSKLYINNVNKDITSLNEIEKYVYFNFSKPREIDDITELAMEYEILTFSNLIIGKKFIHKPLIYLLKKLYKNKVIVRPNILEMIKKITEKLQREDYLVHFKEFDKLPFTNTKEKIDYIIIPTANRPDYLKRALNEVFRVDCDVPVIVADDSLEEEIQEKNIEVIKDSNNSQVFYINNKKRKEISKVISSKTGIELSLVEACLTKTNDKHSSGALRNYALISTIGSNVIFVDDDVCFSKVYNFSEKDNTTLDSRAYFHNLRFEEISDMDIYESNLNVIDLVSNNLNRNINEFESEVNYLSSKLQSALSKSVGDIKVVLFGHCGHSVFNNQNYSLTKNYLDKDHISKREDFSEYLNYEYIANYHKGNVINEMSSFVSMCFGLSNKTMSPMFSPYGRNDDGFFIHLLSLLHPNQFQHINKEAILHLRKENPNNNFDVSYEYRIDKDIINIFNLLFNKVGSVEDNYVYLGEQIIEFTNCDDISFKSKMNHIIGESVMRDFYMNNMVMYLNKGYSNNWFEMVENLSNKIESNIKDDYFKNHDIKIIKDELNLFGQMIKAWPRIWNEAKLLNVDFMERIR